MDDQPTTCGARRAGDAFPGCIREPGHPGYHHEKQHDRDVSWLDSGEWFSWHANGSRTSWDGSHVFGKTASLDIGFINR
jgi:hypothetical protein